jgi:hypothetical protein
MTEYTLTDLERNYLARALLACGLRAPNDSSVVGDIVRKLGILPEYELQFKVYYNRAVERSKEPAK